MTTIHPGVDRRTGRERREGLATEAGEMAVRVDTHGSVRGVRAESGSLVRLVAPALLIGLGMAALMDDIVFHHLLQWHHVTSSGFRPGQLVLPNGPEELRADGLLQAGGALLIVIGLVTLWVTAARRPHALWGVAGASFVGWILFGWALFNILFVSLPAFVLDRHHVNVVGGGQLGWDLIYVGVSLTLAALGLGLAVQGRPRDSLHDDWVG